MTYSSTDLAMAELLASFPIPGPMHILNFLERLTEKLA